MVVGMATSKLTITLPDEQLQEIRALVAAGQAANVSAFVQHAVGIALSDAAGWREMLQEALKQTGGSRRGGGAGQVQPAPLPPQLRDQIGHRDVVPTSHHLDPGSPQFLQHTLVVHDVAASCRPATLGGVAVPAD